MRKNEYIIQATGEDATPTATTSDGRWKAMRWGFFLVVASAKLDGRKGGRERCVETSMGAGGRGDGDERRETRRDEVDDGGEENWENGQQKAGRGREGLPGANKTARTGTRR
ncbi:hypothetical protein TWF696_008209 [Orbilia brochopaga]|uniref:Uncharacterized protein n=1 Tax=Orbilia brochopaga TaxID=3140254 RepID=A0AAV9UF45_9PEZI